jgi:hypothetical protein
MGAIVFLTTESARGAVRVKGPVTGIEYVISPQGDPVSSLDAPQLLDMVADPCCGTTLPFGGKVRLFGKTVGTKELLGKVTSQVRDAVPLVVEKPKPKRARRKRRAPKVVELTESVVEEPAEVPVEVVKPEEPVAEIPVLSGEDDELEIQEDSDGNVL